MDTLKTTQVLLVGVFVFVLVSISGLFNPLLMNAAKYAQISREILNHGDWINLNIAGEAYEQKPPLLFWLGATAYSLFGFSPVVYKLAVILVSLAGIFATFKLGELLYGRKIGILASLFWAVSLGQLHFHNDIHTDTLLAEMVILSIWQYAVYFKKKKPINFVLAVIFTGLAMLTKGPVGMAIPAFAVGSHLIMKKQYREIIHWRWLAALPLVFVIILPALWGLLNQFGLEGLKFYFWTNNAGRITGSYQGNGADYFFALHTSAYMLAPWTIFAFIGIVMQIREQVKAKFRIGSSEFYTLGGILIFLMILTVSSSQKPHYMLSVLPLMAIIGARWAFEIFETSSSKLKNFVVYANRFLAVLFFLIIPLFGFWFYPESRIWVWMVVFAFIALAIYSLIKLRGLTREVTLLLSVIGGLMFFLNVSMYPQMSVYHSPLLAVADFNKEAKEGEKLHIYTPQARYWSIFYYSKSPGYYMIEPSDFSDRKLDAGQWIFISDEGLKQLNEMAVKYRLHKSYDHRSMTSQSIKFLNPKTRAQRLQKRYLIQLTK